VVVMATQESMVIDNLAAMRAQKEGRGTTSTSTGPLTQKDILDLQRRGIELLHKIDKATATGADKREASRVSAGLKWYVAQNNFHAAMTESKGKDYRTRLAEANKWRIAVHKAETKYNEKIRDTDSKLLMRVQDAVRGVTGKEAVTGSFDVLHEDILGGRIPSPQIATDDPGYVATLELVMEQVNKKNHFPIFEFDKNKMINWPKARNYLQDKSGLNITGDKFNKIQDWVLAYNAGRQRQNAHLESARTIELDTDKEFQAAQKALERLQKGEITPDQANQAFEGWLDAESHRTTMFKAMNGLGDEDELKQLLEDARYQKDSRKAAKDHLAAISNLTGSAQSDAMTNIAKMVADPNFRAWAADYGFDNIGDVGVGSDGLVNPDAYRMGGDDINAILAWKKQSMRRGGNYGLRGIRTGEVLRVELKDGSVVEGARLRRHAADPRGAIRVVTEDGARLIAPEEVTQAIFLQRPKFDVTRIDRRAMRIHRKNKDKYARLSTEAVDLVDVEEFVRWGDRDEDEFLRDPSTGRYISDAEYRTARSDRDQKSYKSVWRGAELFAISPDGSVYQIQGGGVIARLDEAKSAELLASPEANNAENIFIKNDDGSFRLASVDDFNAALEAGRIDASFSTQSSIDSEDQPAFDEAQLSSLGLSVGGRPGRYHGVPLTEGEGSTGILFRDLGERESVELPDDPPEAPEEDPELEEIMGEPTPGPYDVVAQAAREEGAVHGDPTLGGPKAVEGILTSERLLAFSRLPKERREQFPSYVDQLNKAIAAGTLGDPEFVVPGEGDEAVDSDPTGDPVAVGAPPTRAETRKQKKAAKTKFKNLKSQLKKEKEEIRDEEEMSEEEKRAALSTISTLKKAGRQEKRQALGRRVRTDAKDTKADDRSGLVGQDQSKFTSGVLAPLTAKQKTPAIEQVFGPGGYFSHYTMEPTETKDSDDVLGKVQARRADQTGGLPSSQVPSGSGKIFDPKVAYDDLDEEAERMEDEGLVGEETSTEIKGGEKTTTVTKRKRK
jgi:hypothetical protein